MCRTICRVVCGMWLFVVGDSSYAQFAGHKFVVSESNSEIGQVLVSSDIEGRYAAYRRAGLTAFLQADYKQAEDAFRNALAEARSFGSFDRRLATALNDLAVLYSKTGRLGEAEELLQQSVTILRTHDPGRDLCVVLNSLGQVYLQENRQKDAERTLAVALSLARNARGPRDDSVSDVLSNLGLLQVQQKKYRQAEESFLRSLEIRQMTPGKVNFKVANALNDLGTLYTLQSRYLKAEDVLARSLKISEELLPPTHPDLAFVLENLAVVENKLQHFETSEAYFRRTIAIQTEERAMSRPELLAVFADTLRNLNKPDEAAVLLEKTKRLLDQQRFTVKSNRP